MNWLRSKAKRLSLLALLALALQLGLSSGHIHHNAAFAAAGNASVAMPDTGLPQDTDDYCALCATVTIASATLVDAAPPALPVPQAFAAFRPVSTEQSVAPWSRRHFFQSRGPPLS